MPWALIDGDKTSDQTANKLNAGATIMNKFILVIGCLFGISFFLWYVAPKVLLFCCVDDPLPPAVRTKFDELNATKREVMALVGGGQLIRGALNKTDLKYAYQIYTEVSGTANGLLDTARNGLDVSRIDTYLNDKLPKVISRAKYLVVLLEPQSYDPYEVEPQSYDPYEHKHSDTIEHMSGKFKRFVEDYFENSSKVVLEVISKVIETNNRDWELVVAKKEKLESVTKKQLDDMKWPSWPDRK